MRSVLADRKKRQKGHFPKDRPEKDRPKKQRSRTVCRKEQSGYAGRNMASGPFAAVWAGCRREVEQRRGFLPGAVPDVFCAERGRWLGFGGKDGTGRSEIFRNRMNG